MKKFLILSGFLILLLCGCTIVKQENIPVPNIETELGATTPNYWKLVSNRVKLLTDSWGLEVQNATTTNLSATTADITTLTIDTLTVVDSTSSSGTVTIFATSTNPVLTVKQYGTGSILQLQDADTTVFSVLDGGTIVLKSGDTIKNNTASTTSISGQLGVGTTTPEAVLSVSALVQSSSSLFQVASTTNKILFEVKPSGRISIGNGVVSNPFFLMNSDLSVDLLTALNINGFTATSNAGMFTYLNHPVNSDSPNTNRHGGTIRIDNESLLSWSGYSNGLGGVNRLGVGIGTTSPEALLSVESASTTRVTLKVKGKAGQTSDLMQVASSTDDIYFVIKSATGRVGIGTTTPATLTDFYSPATTTITIDSSNATLGSCLKLRDEGTNTYTYCVSRAGTLICSVNSCE